MTTFRFHHAGIACESIDREAAAWAALGFAVESRAFTDDMQGIRGQFLTGPGTRIELLEALQESPVLTPWLRAGSRIYHLAFETPDLEVGIGHLRETGAVVVKAPEPAPAFDGRRIAFLMLPGMQLVELVETAGSE